LSDSKAAAERRAKQTVRNLVYALLATVGLVVLVVAGVPRDDSNRIQKVDYVAEAKAASEAVGQLALAPELPEGWWSNSARLEKTAGVTNWYTGFVTGESEYIGLRQAFESNPSWVALTLERNWYERDIEVAGNLWQVWPELRPTEPPSTMNTAWLIEKGDVAIVIFGTATEAEFIKIAEAMAPQIQSFEEAG
jgi:hypothetical protein